MTIKVKDKHLFRLTEMGKFEEEKKEYKSHVNNRIQIEQIQIQDQVIEVVIYTCDNSRRRTQLVERK